jgi:hypothetical protein
MGRMAGSEEAAKVRTGDNQRTMVRAGDPTHLSLIRRVLEMMADRADRKTKKLLTKTLALRRTRKKGPHRPHRPLPAL